jgi:hypothetical protein
LVVAALCASGGVFRMVKLDGPPDRDVLFFFIAAVVVLLADSVKRFKFGDMEFERIQGLEERVQELADVSRTPAVALAAAPLTAAAGAVHTAAPVLTHSLETEALALAERIYQPPLRWEDDPVARQSGSSSASSSTLKARVSPSKNYEDRFRVAIDLEVGADVDLGHDGRVAFFLHHTFPERMRLLPLEHRRASLVLISGGSFTVGALLPDGTFLVLDLTKANLDELSSSQRRIFLTT